MRKLLLIALKDVSLIFRDRTALIFMLLAPFALTMGLGLVTGRFSGSSNTGISDIPIVIVNADKGSLGNALVETMQSNDLAQLLEPKILTDYTTAQKMVDDNQMVAAIYIPAGFTDSIIPVENQPLPENVFQIQLYTNPTAPTSVGVIKNILDQFMSQVEVGRIGGQVSVTQLLTSGIIQPNQAMSVGQTMGESQASAFTNTSSIKVNSLTTQGKAVEFDVLAVLAPGMALMFLMFTVTYGGRSLLSEQTSGTLPRMLISPTTSSQILGGKMFGIFLSGVAQMFILIGGTSLLFKLDWGDPAALVSLVLTATLAATGWGMLLAATLKTPGQISGIGSAIMLIFGLLGGSFTNMAILPNWVQVITYITPNRWGLDAFNTLAYGGTVSDILPALTALLIMSLVLFTISVVIFTRRGIGRL